MCVVSNIGDHFTRDRFPQNDWQQYHTHPELVTKEEFNKLKAEMEALKKLLKAAKIYDEETGQPDCEMEDKVAIIKDLAEKLGVDLEDVFK